MLVPQEIQRAELRLSHPGVLDGGDQPDFGDAMKEASDVDGEEDEDKEERQARGEEVPLAGAEAAADPGGEPLDVEAGEPAGRGRGLGLVLGDEGLPVVILV